MLTGQNDMKRWAKDTTKEQYARYKEGNLSVLWESNGLTVIVVKWTTDMHLDIEATGSLDTDAFGEVVGINI